MKDNALTTSVLAGCVSAGSVKDDSTTWRAVVRVLRSPAVAFEDLLTSVFPGDCRVCDGPLPFHLVSSTLRNLPVCERCVTSLRAQQGLLCSQCGEAIGMESERFVASHRAEVLCAECRMVPPAFLQATAFGVYEGELREMTHLLKYEGVQSLAPVLGTLLAKAIKRLSLGPDVLMVAVPLFPAKQRMRGYNQAVLLGNAAARHLRHQVKLQAAHDCLLRVRDTESQFALSPAGRRRNLRGAFRAARQNHIAGRQVLLIDDIYTTGATARECARVLLHAGAGEVFVATLARAQREAVALWDGRLKTPQSFSSDVELRRMS